MNYNEKIEDELIVSTMLHEAAHAVIGYRLGSKIQEINIAGVRAGDVTSWPADNRSMAVVSLAGAAAEEEANKRNEDDRYQEFFAGLRKSPHAPAPAFASDGDLIYVRQYVKQTRPGELYENRLEATPLYRQLRAEARDLVRENWTVICALASEINKRMGDAQAYTMNGTEFDTFMRGK